MKGESRTELPSRSPLPPLKPSAGMDTKTSWHQPPALSETKLIAANPRLLRAEKLKKWLAIPIRIQRLTLSMRYACQSPRFDQLFNEEKGGANITIKAAACAAIHETDRTGEQTHVYGGVYEAS